jgi:hypothetical protein
LEEKVRVKRRILEGGRENKGRLALSWKLPTPFCFKYKKSKLCVW